MDQKLSSEIQASITAVEQQLEGMKDLASLNDRLGQANAGLMLGADALRSAAEDFPHALANFKMLSERLQGLSQVLEGSDLAVLVSKVNKIEDDLEHAKTSATEANTAVNEKITASALAIKSELSAESKSIKEEISEEINVLAEELEAVRELIEESSSEASKQATTLKAVVGIAAVATIIAVIVSSQ